MLFFGSNFKKFITKNLLYYVWLELKLKRRYFFYYFDPFFSDPLSQSWFYKTSDLLKNGYYQYNNNVILSKVKHFSKKIILGLMKTKVLENTFLFICLLQLSKNIIFKSINLTECVCLLLKQYKFEICTYYRCGNESLIL
jgi:hypothetical protein